MLHVRGDELSLLYQETMLIVTYVCSRPHQALKEEPQGPKDRIDFHRQPDKVQATMLEIHVHTCDG